MAEKILITGGAGFIGTHLCQALIQSGRTVRALDLKDPTRPIEGVEYLKGDVRDSVVVEKAVSGVQAVYHFAAIASVPLCQENPYESTRTNLLSTALVMERLAPHVRFIFSGSSAVYGNSGSFGEKLQENRTAQDFASFYAAQKFGSETLIRQFHQARGTPAMIFRFFNVYGQGQDPKSPYTGVITAFREAIRTGRPIQLNGGGEQTRDFVSVDDIVRALILALECPVEICDAQPINLGTGQPTTIRELGVLMRNLSGPAAENRIALKDAPWREGDVRHSTADIRLAKEKLKWAPRISLETGLKSLL